RTLETLSSSAENDPKRTWWVSLLNHLASANLAYHRAIGAGPSRRTHSFRSSNGAFSSDCRERHDATRVHAIDHCAWNENRVAALLGRLVDDIHGAQL